MGAMNLDLPTEGGDSGVWDTKINTALGVVEEHDHTTGQGNPVPSAGININAALTFGGNNATNMGAVGFTGILATAAPNASLFRRSSDNELIWKTSGGTSVQLTNGNTLNSALLGGITGDYSSTDADVEYVDADKTYEIKQDEGPDHWAKIKVGDIHLLEPSSGITNAVRLKSPTALAAGYDVTFPAAVPGSTSFVTMSSAGALAVSKAVPANPAKQAAVQMTSAGVFQTSTGFSKIYSWKNAEVASLGNWALSTADGLLSTTTTSDLAVLWLDGLPTNMRIVAGSVHLKDGSTSTIEIRLNEVADDGTMTQLGTLQTSAGSGAKQTLTVTATSPTAVTTTKKYAITAESKGVGGNARIVYSAWVELDYGA